MKLQCQSDPITLTLELDDGEYLKGCSPQERDLVRKMTHVELDNFVQAIGHLLAAAMKSGPLRGVLLDLLMAKVYEVSDVGLKYIQEIRNGKDPMDIVSTYLLAMIEVRELENGPFADFLDGLDMDPPFTE